MDDKDFELNKNALNAREESVAESVEGGSGLSVEKISVTEDTTVSGASATEAAFADEKKTAENLTARSLRRLRSA